MEIMGSCGGLHGNYFPHVNDTHRGGPGMGKYMPPIGNIMLPEGCKAAYFPLSLRQGWHIVPILSKLNN